MTRKELLIQEAARYIARSRQLKEGEVISMKEREIAKIRNTPISKEPEYTFHDGWTISDRELIRQGRIGLETKGKIPPELRTLGDVADHFRIKVRHDDQGGRKSSPT